MFVECDHLQFNSVGIEKRRSYYVPFDENDKVEYNGKIIKRESSSRFISLDGEWGITEFKGINKVDLEDIIIPAIKSF